MASNSVLLWVTLFVMLLGLLGSVLPSLPGVPLIFASALVYAYVTDFEVVGWWVIVLLGLFALLAFGADFLGTTYGVRRFGASNWGMVGGSVGGLVGLLIGTIGGVFIGGYLRRERHGAAASATSSRAYD